VCLADMISKFNRVSLLGRTAFRSVQQFRKFSAPLPAHINTLENNADIPFEFTPENMKQIESLLTKYPSNYKQSLTIPLLYIAQDQCGNWIPLSAMNKIAEVLDLNPMRVYEVATFYTMFNRSKVGKFHLQVCGTTPCLVRGSDKIISALEEHLGIKEGHTTKDGMFTVTEVECLAACANAPMMQVNNEVVYEDLTPENTIQLLEDLKNGCAKAGPQNGRNQSEAEGGRSSLKGEIPIRAKFRDMAQVRAEYEAAQAAPKQ